jgi:hypothetical protein
LGGTLGLDGTSFVDHGLHGLVPLKECLGTHTIWLDAVMVLEEKNIPG